MLANYNTIIPDKDNIIPITDEEYFDDDMVALMVNFVKVVYGKILWKKIWTLSPMFWGTKAIPLERHCEITF